ncbi:MAG: hypothetical protein WCI03_09760 [bacterium]|jgi:hypothetical protein
MTPAKYRKRRDRREGIAIQRHACNQEIQHISFLGRITTSIGRQFFEWDRNFDTVSLVFIAELVGGDAALVVVPPSLSVKESCSCHPMMALE